MKNRWRQMICKVKVTVDNDVNNTPPRWHRILHTVPSNGQAIALSPKARHRTCWQTFTLWRHNQMARQIVVQLWRHNRMTSKCHMESHMIWSWRKVTWSRWWPTANYLGNFRLLLWSLKTKYNVCGFPLVCRKVHVMVPCKKGVTKWNCMKRGHNVNLLAEDTSLVITHMASGKSEWKDKSKLDKSPKENGW